MDPENGFEQPFADSVMVIHVMELP